MMQTNPAHLEYLTRLGDTALVLGQRLSEWCGHGPALEEELALTNISLDLVGQARLVLSHTAALEGNGRDEDALAYFRDESQFRNWTLAELPNGATTGATARDDYASTIVRNFLICALMVPLWEALTGSSDEKLAQIAAKSVKEARAHLRHARGWLVRFGDGTDESHARAQAALDRLWPYTNEFWDADAVEREAAALGVGVVVAELEAPWSATVDAALSQATLRRPARSAFLSSGKRGAHSEHLGYLLAEMQVLARQHPGATW